jgi:hypothetical protein
MGQPVQNHAFHHFLGPGKLWKHVENVFFLVFQYKIMQKTRSTLAINTEFTRNNNVTTM